MIMSDERSKIKSVVETSSTSGWADWSVSVDRTASFRRHAIPRLIKRARVKATSVALGESTFADAFADIYLEAGRLGSALLSSDSQDGLEDWIFGALVREIERAGSVRPDARRALADIEAWTEVVA